MRILAVDDDPLMRTTHELMLGRDHAVRTAGSVDEAREALSASHPQYDAVLLDLHLERGSHRPTGLALIDPARQHSPSARIIIISAASDEATIQRAMASGADHYLVKDFDLRARLRELLG